MQLTRHIFILELQQTYFSIVLISIKFVNENLSNQCKSEPDKNRSGILERDFINRIQIRNKWNRTEQKLS